MMEDYSDVASENLVLVVDLDTSQEGLTSESLSTALPPSSRSTTQNQRVLADSEDWAMVMSLCSGYFGMVQEFHKPRMDETQCYKSLLGL